MIKKVGGESEITSDPNAIVNASKLVLCGVGAFDDGMNRLEKMGVIDVLNKKILDDKVPILGICLGMQLMTNSSEEGKRNGLGWVKGKTKRFKFDANNTSLRIPHMGWNRVIQKKESLLFQDMNSDPRFYFVHSYHVDLEKDEHILTETNYGQPFTSAFEVNNIIGVQFHPEKSHKFGIKLFENFINHY